MDSPGSLPVPTNTTGCTCGPYWSVVPPGPCPIHRLDRAACAPPIFGQTFTLTTTFPPALPARNLTDADVEAVARRVVELLEAKTGLK